jgi:hypothetical protein
MEEFDAFVPKVKKTHVAIYFDTVGNMTIQGHKPCVDMFVIRVEIERGTSPIYENTRHAAWIIDEVTNIVRQVSAEDIAPRVNVHQQSRMFFVCLFIDLFAFILYNNSPCVYCFQGYVT